MTQTNVNKKCPYSRHSGPVGCLPLLKGKYFWNFPSNSNKIITLLSPEEYDTDWKKLGKLIFSICGQLKI